MFACGLTLFCDLAWVIISYDIACQWYINLAKRMEEWPKAWRLSPNFHKTPVVPAFHFPAHKIENHDEYDTRLCEGLGTLDLEAIERLWAAIGMLGLATKTMAPASRILVLDDNFGFYNWLKYISHGKRKSN